MLERVNLSIVGPRFTLGKIVWTAGVNDALDEEEDGEFAKFCAHSLARHCKGDWGDVPPEDKRANDQALVGESRLLSAYEQAPFKKIWIITEADRSVTTVLFPDEY